MRAINTNRMHRAAELLSQYQYPTARILLAIFTGLFFYFYFQSIKILTSTATIDLTFIFGNPLGFTPVLVKYICLLGICTSVFFAIGYFVRFFAILNLLIVYLLINFNFEIFQVQYVFLMYCYLSFILFSNEKFFTLKKSTLNSRFEEGRWRYLLLSLISLSLLTSGLSKLFIAEWYNGESLMLLCTRSYFSNFMKANCQYLDILFLIAAWMVILAEVTAIFYIFCGKARFYIWFITFVFYAGLFILMPSVRQIAAPFIILEIILFDIVQFHERWRISATSKRHLRRIGPEKMVGGEGI